MKNERKRVFGTQIYVTFEGGVEDEGGNPVRTYKSRSNTLMFKWGKKTYSVAKYVAHYFIRISKKRIHYIDGDKTNTAAWNLEYIDTEGITLGKYEKIFRGMSHEGRDEIFQFITDSTTDFYVIADTFNIPIGVAGMFVKKSRRKHLTNKETCE